MGFSKSLFGWSYPPGCSGPPDDDEQCELCGQHVDNCLCPECLVCGEVGEPSCYEDHGMTLSQAQIAGRAAMEKAWEDQAAAEYDHFSKSPLEEGLFDGLEEEDLLFPEPSMNPRCIFASTRTELLMQAMEGLIDLNELAKAELQLREGPLKGEDDGS